MAKIIIKQKDIVSEYTVSERYAKNINGMILDGMAARKLDRLTE